MGLTQDMVRSQPPAGMECLSMCSAWEGESTDSRGGGVAKLYHGVSATWGFLEVNLPDVDLIPTDAYIVAHLHVTGCSPNWATAPPEQDILLLSGQQFLWPLPGYGNTTRSRSIQYELQVPLPEHGAKSIVVHEPSEARHMCCNLEQCVPPPEYTCKASCPSWELADKAVATAVRGRSELWTNGLDSWMFIDLAFDPLDRTDSVWKASWEVSLFDGTSKNFGMRWNPMAPLVHKLSGSDSVGHMRVEVHHFHNLDLPEPDRMRVLVVSHENGALATCQVEVCSGRQVPQIPPSPPPPIPPDSTRWTGAQVAGVVIAAMAAAVLIGAGALFYAFGWRPCATGRHCPGGRNPDSSTGTQLPVVAPQHGPPPRPANPDGQVDPRHVCPVNPADSDAPLLPNGNSFGMADSRRSSRRPDDIHQEPFVQRPPAGLEPDDDRETSTDSDQQLLNRGGSMAPTVCRPQQQQADAPHLTRAHQDLPVQLPEPDGAPHGGNSVEEILPPTVAAPSTPNGGHVLAGNSSTPFQPSRPVPAVPMPLHQPTPEPVQWFARCLYNVDRIQRGLRTPQCAAPVAQELSQLIRCRASEGDKYMGLVHVHGSLYAWNAAAKLQRIAFHTQQMFLLLVACVAPVPFLVQSEKQMQELASRTGSSSTVTRHLKLLRTFFAMMKSRPSAADVDYTLRELQRTNVQFREPEIQKLEQAYYAIQRNKQWPSDIANGNLIASFSGLSRCAEALRKNVQCIVDLVRKEAADMEAADIVQVLEQMEGEDDEIGIPARKLLHSPNSADFCDFLLKCTRAAQHGRVQMSFCFAANKPFSRLGSCTPVKLPCDCTVTYLKAFDSRSTGECSMCHQRFSDTHFALNVDTAMQQIVQLSAYGLQKWVPFPPENIQLRHKLGQGSQATVYAAILLRGEQQPGEHVAVKELTLQPRMSTRRPRSIAALYHSITTTLLASANPHVCQMHGVAWSDDSLWLVMEKCESSLSLFVDHVRCCTSIAGLPQIDVLVLGWMLLDALGTVHDYAKSLHLDIKPDNVMLAPIKPGQNYLRRRTIKLIDFGLGVALATHTSDISPSWNVDNPRGWTPAYSPPEQMNLINTRPASDVYAVGATMLYAATAQRPYGMHTTTQGVIQNHSNNIPMPVAEYLPDELRCLISDMTQILPDRRPTRFEAQCRIVRMYLQLQRQGEVAQYLAPHWGMPTREPVDITVC